MSALEDLGAAIKRALAEEPTHEVLGVLTGSLVGLVVELARRRGASVDCDIRIDGGQRRDLTIHAPKTGDQHGA